MGLEMANVRCPTYYVLIQGVQNTLPSHIHPNLHSSPPRPLLYGQQYSVSFSKRPFLRDRRAVEPKSSHIMSSSDSFGSDESFQEDTQPTIRRHNSSAYIGARQQSSPSLVDHASQHACRASRHHPHRPGTTSNSLRRSERPSAASPLPRFVDTEFKYMGSIEQYGWKPGQVPLFLEWYPEKLDRRSTLKFFENGKEYVIGRAPSCDIFFQNLEPDSGISGNHLRIKTVLVPGSVNKIYVWITDQSTNGTYVNGVKIAKGVPVQLCPDDHVTILKRDNAVDSRPNIGFRVVMALEKPKLEDYYAILKSDILGTGTFGAVHKAKCLETGKTVAVKMIRSLHGSNVSQDLEREIRIMKKLDHPHIVQFRDSFEETKEHDITRYIVMEYMEGGTLHNYIQTSDLMSENTIQHIIRQILCALEYMHERHQVCHRDLKPANILLGDRGQYPTVKIADLGLAKIEAATKNNTFCGSPGYLAPECTQGPQAAGLNWAMDIYAVGVITYELFTGKRPFGTDMKKDPYLRKIPMELLQHRKCSPEAIEFMTRLLNLDPNERPSARECSLHPWLSGDVDYDTMPPRVTKILPPTEISGPPSGTVRATLQMPSPGSESSFRSSSSSASSSASSEDSEDERTRLVDRLQKGSRLQPAASFFSDRMDICSVRSSQTCLRSPNSASLRSPSPMNVDTMVPADKVWCILHPIPGNIVGTTTLFLRKPTTTMGSDVGADFILRHPKIEARHCTIVAEHWDEQYGFTGMICVHDRLPVRFHHKSTIYILDDENDYIGYTVTIPGLDNHDTSIAFALNRLSITPHSVKRRSDHFYTPHTLSKRRCTSEIASIASTQALEIEVVSLTPGKIMRNKETGRKLATMNTARLSDKINPKPWAVLKSKTTGKPDIPLIRYSTGFGNACEFVDISTGERLQQNSCRIFRLPNGNVGVYAVEPVVVNDESIIHGGKSLLLKPGQKISLRGENMSVIAEYEIRFPSYSIENSEETQDNRAQDTKAI